MQDMSILKMFARPATWGGLAAVVLGLEMTGHLDTAVARVSSVVQALQGSGRDTFETDIAAAQLTAQQYLPRYLAAAVRAPEDWELRALKVMLDPARPETAVWVETFDVAEGEAFTGRRILSKQPDGAAAETEDLTFTIDQIVDWAFVRDGTGFGYFTVHASLPYMPEAQAVVTRNFLAEQPLPSHW